VRLSGAVLHRSRIDDVRPLPSRGSAATRGPSVLDIGIIAAIKLYDPAELPGTLLITAVTLGELSYGRMRLTIR
jgi:hypothetical protein